MKKIYLIPKGQLIVIIVFGAIGELISLINTTDCSSGYGDSCGFLGFLSIFIPFLIVFYLVGWIHFNKKKEPSKNTIEDNSLKEIKNKDFIFCIECGYKNTLNSKYCIKCGESIIN